jgi:hypothetical protein
LLSACATAPPPPPPPDPAVAVLEGLIAKKERAGDRGACLAALREDMQCEPLAREREHGLTIALDPRYKQIPNWRKRLKDTLRCVNAIYKKTGISWRINRLFEWDPGAERHQLYPLLARLRKEVAGDGKTLRLGITVWEKRRIYRMAGGEIGLSQAGACVVPSWPRPENDCIILAHELGHLIGAIHVPGKQWVMGWATHPFYLPGVDPLARVVQRYSFHPRNIEAIRITGQATMTRHGFRVGPRCRKHLADLDRCYGF